ncbi:unnamed protein product [Arctogadus glacialis]
MAAPSVTYKFFLGSLEFELCWDMTDHRGGGSEGRIVYQRFELTLVGMHYWRGGSIHLPLPPQLTHRNNSTTPNPTTYCSPGE